MQAECIRINGTVQGVGFRPHVWRLARQFGVRGTVSNDNCGVVIHAWGDRTSLEQFAASIQAQKPPLAIITQVERAPLVSGSIPEDFRIVASTAGQTLTAVSADAATCPQCLQEINDSANRRHGYPFTNCTHCGPRYSIIQAVPYDRINTSMAGFVMCEACGREYADPGDRRFHAQPNACPECGPTLWLEGRELSVVAERLINHDAIVEAANQIRQGRIVAIKGIGGFHLACDAGNSDAVATLRQRKRRYGKPLAVMATDVAMVRRYANPDELELEALQSTAAPIVLLDKCRIEGIAPLADALAPGQHSLGFMLPYSPLHHLLMRQLQNPIVLTSGNLSDEPQCIANDEAKQRLGEIADLFLLHNREIVNRTDDSVVVVAGGELQLIRRARGYAPQPLPLPAGFENASGVLALGADLKNTFCLLHNGQAIVSTHIGDLEEVATQQACHANIGLMSQLYDFEPALVAVDKHPNYHASHIGRGLAGERGIHCEEVQHHHAHIASVMAENQLPINSDAVLGIALDGLGFGDDGHFWGGEFLLADYRCSQRLARFKPAAMLGGNLAMKEPWRNTLAQLLASGQWPQLQQQFATTEMLQFLAAKPLEILQTMADRGLNSPQSSSAGRLFDAVAALLGLCREQQWYEGEAAMRLEALANTFTASPTDSFPFSWQLQEAENVLEIDWAPMWSELLQACTEGGASARLARRFHHTVSAAIVAVVQELQRQCPFRVVVLSGGVLQNRLLRQLLQAGLQACGCAICFPRQLPANDAGIALGQAVIAFARGELPRGEMP